MKIKSVPIDQVKPYERNTAGFRSRRIRGQRAASETTSGIGRADRRTVSFDKAQEKAHARTMAI